MELAVRPTYRVGWRRCSCDVPARAQVKLPARGIQVCYVDNHDNQNEDVENKDKTVTAFIELPKKRHQIPFRFRSNLLTSLSSRLQACHWSPCPGLDADGGRRPSPSGRSCSVDGAPPHADPPAPCSEVRPVGRGLVRRNPPAVASGSSAAANCAAAAQPRDPHRM